MEQRAINLTNNKVSLLKWKKSQKGKEEEEKKVYLGIK